MINPVRVTTNQIALAIRDEVVKHWKKQASVSSRSMKPAIREGLPLRKAKRLTTCEWAVKAFRISASGVKDKTQDRLRICAIASFNDIIEHIAAMDADVITIETSD